MPDATTKKQVKRQVEAIYNSQEEMDEVDRYFRETGASKGRVFVRAVLVFINREKKAGRWGV